VKRTLVTGLILNISGASHADSISRYAPAGYCTKVSELSGGSRTIYNGCLSMEQDAYDTLKSSWGQFADSAKRYCDGVARSSDSSYCILKGCIDMEAEASSSEPEFRY
jgi:hypothetical protein